MSHNSKSMLMCPKVHPLSKTKDPRVYLQALNAFADIRESRNLKQARLFYSQDVDLLHITLRLLLPHRIFQQSNYIIFFVYFNLILTFYIIFIPQELQDINDMYRFLLEETIQYHRIMHSRETLYG